MALLVDLADELLDIGGDLGLRAAASICRAPSRTTSSSSDPPAAPAVFSLDASASRTTLSIGHTFPSRRANADLDQNMQWASILLGRCARLTSPRRGPSTGSDHCSRWQQDRQWLVDVRPAAHVLDPLADGARRLPTCRFSIREIFDPGHFRLPAAAYAAVPVRVLARDRHCQWPVQDVDLR
jgi:hypothetical protein